LKKSKAKKSVRRKKSDWALSLVHDVWPQERDFFERPERYRYVRKLLPETSECVFCAALKAGVGFESLVLAKDEHCMVLMNKYPYNTGHLLITPLKHVGELWNLDDKTNAALALWLKKCTAILKKL